MAIICSSWIPCCIKYSCIKSIKLDFPQRLIPVMTLTGSVSLKAISCSKYLCRTFNCFLRFIRITPFTCIIPQTFIFRKFRA